MTRVLDEYLWVFRQGSEEFDIIKSGGELAKHVTRIQAVDGEIRTIKSPDSETLDGYLASNSEFIVLKEGRAMWVFRRHAPELTTILNGGELAKHTTKLSSDGTSVTIYKSNDSETIEAYLAQQQDG